MCTLITFIVKCDSFKTHSRTYYIAKQYTSNPASLCSCKNDESPDSDPLWQVFPLWAWQPLCPLVCFADQVRWQGVQEADVKFWKFEEWGELQRCGGAPGEGDQAAQAAGAEGEPGRDRHGPGTNHHWPPSHRGGLLDPYIGNSSVCTMFCLALRRSHFVAVYMVLN